MTIKVGERLPNAALRLVTPDGPKPVETKDYFAGKTVVLFGLPDVYPGGTFLHWRYAPSGALEKFS